MTTTATHCERPRIPRILAVGANVAIAVSAMLSMCTSGCVLAGEASPVNFERDIQPILDEYCVLCHMTGAENGGLNLESGKSLANLWNVHSTESDLARVTPGDPAKSYLLHKIKGTHLQVGGNGLQMPLGGLALNTQVIQLIEQWIHSESPR